jgi:hypothetical protein
MALINMLLMLPLLALLSVTTEPKPRLELFEKLREWRPAVQLVGRLVLFIACTIAVYVAMDWLYHGLDLTNSR